MTKSILVVEDEAIVRESLKDWLGEEGYVVTIAEDGEQALQILGKEDFGVVILDLKLPGKDGIMVLKEAKAGKPELKVIVITAYPSTETAEEAMKMGAIDYLVKPFSPIALEQLVREALQPGKVEVSPEVIERKRVEVGRREEEIQSHLEQGKDLFRKGDYTGALKEFEGILTIAPGNLQARVWIRKSKEALTTPQVETIPEETGVKECLWMKIGVISHRLCTRDYDCLTCEFDQTMQSRAAEESPEIAAALERLKGLPGNQRLCRYVLKGDVSYRLCTHLFQCIDCEFGQIMQDALAIKLAKLQARRDALRQRAARAKAKT